MAKSTKLILLIILGSFLFRGIFLVAVFPIFKGQDESRHYNTVQYLATEKDKDCQNILEIDDSGRKIYNKKGQEKQNLATYRYSDEIRDLVPVVQNKQIRGNYYDKIDFIKDNYSGLGERDFKNKKHSRTQHFCPPDIASSSFGKDGFSLYQWVVAGIEKYLEGQNIFVRYSALRIFSVLLGVIMLGVAYSIFRTVRFSEKQSLILTAIISFQPKLVTYFTNINYDVLLIPLWTGFILVGSLIIKKGWNFSRAVLIAVILAGAIMTKPSALPLLGLGIFLLGGTIYKRFKRERINWAVVGVITIIGGVVSYLLLDKVGVTSLLSGKYLSSLGEYLSKSLPKVYGSSRDYWGAMGWSANNLTLMYVKIIWVIEWAAWVGLGLWIIIPAMKKVGEKINFKLPACPILKKNCPIFSVLQKSYTNFKKYYSDESLKRQKKYFWFMLVAIIVLQIGIRVADWKVFASDGSLSLGTPGRYWLPNIIPHFVLVAMGLQIVVRFFAGEKLKKKYFELVLITFLMLMILYWCYEVFDIIIPRFYM